MSKHKEQSIKQIDGQSEFAKTDNKQAINQKWRNFPEECKDIGATVLKYPFKDGFVVTCLADIAAKTPTAILDYNDIALLRYFFAAQAKGKWEQCLIEAKAGKIPFLDTGELKAYLQRKCNVQEPGLSGIGWPEILKHLRLHKKEQAVKGADAGVNKGQKIGQANTPVTLKEFMRDYCEQLTPNVLDSRIKSLRSLNQRDKIKLERIGEYKRGKKDIYLPSYLIKMWPTYREKLPVLPNLKQV
jgi:hypothetical protein